MELLLEHVGKGFINMLMIAMPCVLTAAGIGLVVGILQAVTQVQEQTIAAAPKIVGVFLVIILLGNVFSRVLQNYFYESLNLAFNVVTKQGNYVLSSEGYLNSKDKTENPDITDVDDILKNPGRSRFGKHKSKNKLTPSTRTPVVTPNLIEGKKITGY